WRTQRAVAEAQDGLSKDSQLLLLVDLVESGMLWWRN
ncbi:hypothetical protein A2U01_0079979, partial [Trifolium medium]|nr:hypothetical protein [Trifolium medium]